MFLKEILSENEPKYIKGVLLEAIHVTLNTPMLDLGPSEVPFVIGFNPIENCDTILLYRDDEIMGFINYNPDANIGEIRANAAVNDAFREFRLVLNRKEYDAISNVKFKLMLMRLCDCFFLETINHWDVPVIMRMMPRALDYGVGYIIYFNLCIRKNGKCFCDDFRYWSDDRSPRINTEICTLKELLKEIRHHIPIKTSIVPVHMPTGCGLETKLDNVTPNDIARWLAKGKISKSELVRLIRGTTPSPLGINQVWRCRDGIYMEKINDELNLHNIDEAINEYIQRHSDSLRRDKIDRIVHATYNLCGLRLKSYKVYG